MENLAHKIKNTALKMGFSAVGICDAEPLTEPAKKLGAWLDSSFTAGMDWMARTREVRPNPRGYFPEARSVIVVAQNYFCPSGKNEYSPGTGKISIYARGRDYHKVVRKKLKKLLDFIQQMEPAARGRVCVDSFPLMEKPLAVKAGIGWIGKHTNLILKGKGSYFFLGEILLSLPLPPDEPLTTDYCGTCTRCLEACPTNALPTPYVLDARRCISYLTIEHDGAIDADLQSRMGNWIFGCDICQEVCPWNRFSETTAEEDFEDRFAEAELGLERLIRLSRSEFEQMSRGSPLRRPGYQNFMRNISIARENQLHFDEIPVKKSPSAFPG